MDEFDKFAAGLLAAATQIRAYDPPPEDSAEPPRTSRFPRLRTLGPQVPGQPGREERQPISDVHDDAQQASHFAAALKALCDRQRKTVAHGMRKHVSEVADVISAHVDAARSPDTRRTPEDVRLQLLSGVDNVVADLVPRGDGEAGILTLLVTGGLWDTITQLSKSASPCFHDDRDLGSASSPTPVSHATERAADGDPRRAIAANPRGNGLGADPIVVTPGWLRASDPSEHPVLPTEPLEDEPAPPEVNALADQPELAQVPTVAPGTVELPAPIRDHDEPRIGGGVI